MRTLFEIIEAAKSGKKPTYDECYWAMLALDSLGSFDRMSLRKLATPGNVTSAKFEWSESFRRIKRALDRDPKKWMGPNNDPSKPEYQKRRNMFKKLVDKVIGDHEQGV